MFQSTDTSGHTGSIVVGIDGSGTTQTPLTWAVREADRAGARLRLVHVRTPGCPPVPSGIRDPGRGIPGSARSGLDHAVAQARHTLSSDRVTGELRTGEVVTVLLDAARGAQMLVVGAQGFFGQADRLTGSTASRVAAHCPCPVVVVVRSRLSDGRGPFPGHVVVGLDDDTAPEPVLGFGFGYAALHGLALAVVRVAPGRPGEPRSGDGHRPELRDGPTDTGTSGSWPGSWEGRYPAVPVTRVVLDGDPLPGLLRVSGAAALLVVGAWRRGPGGGPVPGPVSQGAVGHATCPVAVVGGAAVPGWTGEPTAGRDHRSAVPV